MNGIYKEQDMMGLTPLTLSERETKLVKFDDFIEIQESLYKLLYLQGHYFASDKNSSYYEKDEYQKYLIYYLLLFKFCLMLSSQVKRRATWLQELISTKKLHISRLHSRSPPKISSFL